jgi:hypothetical protein
MKRFSSDFSQFLPDLPGPSTWGVMAALCGESTLNKVSYHTSHCGLIVPGQLGEFLVKIGRSSKPHNIDSVSNVASASNRHVPTPFDCRSAHDPYFYGAVKDSSAGPYLGVRLYVPLRSPMKKQERHVRIRETVTEHPRYCLEAYKAPQRLIQGNWNFPARLSRQDRILR